VRHRPCSFLHESQRYCRYEDEVIFILPEWFSRLPHKSGDDWRHHMSSCENRYREFLKQGLKPQQARAVLPNSTKTELIVYASLPQWKHMFNLRCSPAADPEMGRVMRPLEQEFKTKYPEAFSA
jgi:thymidylate synthase (FAD)